MRKIIWISLSVMSLIALFTMTLVIYSPYTYDQEMGRRLIVTKVTIDRPAGAVFDYLGKSENARDWSIFVDHISALNPNEVADGSVGSVRRCFQHADELEGMVWDEEILDLRQDSYRKLSVFNMRGFPLAIGDLSTEQIYRAIDRNSCELALSLYFETTKPDFWSELKMYLAAYSVASIFQKNLDKIKYYNEL